MAEGGKFLIDASLAPGTYRKQQELTYIFYTNIQIYSSRYKTARHASLNIEHCMKIAAQNIETIF